jgi:hypothetical protein
MVMEMNTTGNILSRLLEPDIMPFLVAIVAIVGGLSVAIVKLLIKHHERITMIQHGIHPDHPPDNKDEGWRWKDEAGSKPLAVSRETTENWKLKTENWKLKTENWKLKTENCKLKTENWKLKTENWKL